jgi:hypothetical protein
MYTGILRARWSPATVARAVHWHAIYKIPIPVEVIDEAASDAIFDSIASATLKGSDGGVETALVGSNDRVDSRLAIGVQHRRAYLHRLVGPDDVIQLTSDASA